PLPTGRPAEEQPVKLFKRTAKEAQAPLTSVPTPSKPSMPALGPLLPGLLAAAAGIAAGSVLLWFAQASHDQARLAERVQAIGSSQAAAVQQALQQLQADGLAATRNPELLQALQNGDKQQLRAAERSLGYWDGVVGAHLNRRG